MEASGCDQSSLVRLSNGVTPCVDLCAQLRLLPGTRGVYELVAIAPQTQAIRWGHVVSGLTALERFGQPAPSPIPVRPKPLGLSDIGWLSGCRYQWIEHGWHAGIRPGTRLELSFPNRGSVSWTALEVWEDRALGVYDVAQIRD